MPPLRPQNAGCRTLTARAILPALLAAALLAGCGGDEETTTRPTRTLPDLAVPTAPATPTTTEETPTSTTVDPATEPLPEEGPETTEEEPPADTPENDAPPPEGTPAERFEEYCNENPGACG